MDGLVAGKAESNYFVDGIEPWTELGNKKESQDVTCSVHNIINN